MEKKIIYGGMKIVVTKEEQPTEIFSSMGCRTINGFDCNFKDAYKQSIKAVLTGKGEINSIRSGAQKDGRGNICPVTIILPTYAMDVINSTKRKDDETEDAYRIRIEDKFIKVLGDAINDAKDMLLERFDYISSQKEDCAKFMWQNNTMKGYIPEEGIRSALKHGTLAIGQLGLAECLEILIGCDHTEEEGMRLAKRIEMLMRRKCNEFKEEYGLNFGVYYTPAESLCYTAMNKFRASYGIIEKVSDKEYFTNSMHIPVWHKCGPFEKIDIESQLTGFSTAGCITYVELEAEVEKNIDAMETLVNYAMQKDIPYFAINVPNDVCKDCGAICNGMDTCPECGSTNIKHLRRVTGYLTSDYKESFNYGKQCEVRDRVKHSGNEIC